MMKHDLAQPYHFTDAVLNAYMQNARIAFHSQEKMEHKIMGNRHKI
jgi:hypothetical protein